MNVAMFAAGYAGDITWPTAEMVARLGTDTIKAHAGCIRPRAILFAAQTAGCI